MKNNNYVFFHSQILYPFGMSIQCHLYNLPSNIGSIEGKDWTEQFGWQLTILFTCHTYFGSIEDIIWNNMNQSVSKALLMDTLNPLHCK